MSILDQKVLLSNFEGRDSVTLREFMLVASELFEEHFYRAGLEEAEVQEVEPTVPGEQRRSQLHSKGARGENVFEVEAKDVMRHIDTALNEGVKKAHDEVLTSRDVDNLFAHEEEDSTVYAGDRRECDIYIQSDEYYCARCNLRWPQADDKPACNFGA